MLAENPTLAVHAGEVQSSRLVAAPVQTWSTNNEAFESEALSSLIITNDWLRAGDTVYVGDQQTIALSDLATADDVVSFMARRATVLGGVRAEGYPQVTNEMKKLLTAAIAGWIALCCPPTFFGVENIRKHTLTDSDLDAAARVVIGGAQ
jgi:hypothetical protein